MGKLHRSRSPSLSSRAVAAIITAAVAAAASSEAMAAVPVTSSVATVAPSEVPSAQPRSLGEWIELGAERAARAGQHDEVEQLGSLWLRLHRRGDLERLVDDGERFVAVALRNQKISDWRSATRHGRIVATDPATLGALAEQGVDAPVRQGGAPDELVDAQRYLEALDEPLRSAVAMALTGMNWREVAEELGVSHAAARKWMQRLRERLRASSH